LYITVQTVTASQKCHLVTRHLVKCIHYMVKGIIAFNKPVLPCS